MERRGVIIDINAGRRHRSYGTPAHVADTARRWLEMWRAWLRDAEREYQQYEQLRANVSDWDTVDPDVRAAADRARTRADHYRANVDELVHLTTRFDADSERRAT